MSAIWHYSIDGRRHGPVEFKALVQMAEDGRLLPTDLVWQKGMDDWVPAATNGDLFPSLDEPPPLPSSQWNWDRLKTEFDKLYANRTLFFAICCAICVAGAICMFALAAIAAAIDLEPLVFVFMLIGVWFPLFALASLIAAVKPFIESLKKRDLIPGRWDLTEGNGPSIQFTEDGGVLRFDGVAGSYEYSVVKQCIRITLDGAVPTDLQVISISKHELILSDGSASQHYKRGESISDAEAKKEMEQAKAALGKAAATAGKAAMVVGGVAAAVGIGVLGVAAAGAASGGGSGGGNRLPCPRCGHMYLTGLLAKAAYQDCQNCGAQLPGR